MLDYLLGPWEKSPMETNRRKLLYFLLRTESSSSNNAFLRIESSSEGLDGQNATDRQTLSLSSFITPRENVLASPEMLMSLYFTFAPRLNLIALTGLLCVCFFHKICLYASLHNLNLLKHSTSLKTQITLNPAKQTKHYPHSAGIKFSFKQSK